MDGGTQTGGTLHRFTVHDYHRMAKAGVFGVSKGRIELVRGTVVDMASIGTPHFWTVNTLNMLFAPLLKGRAVVSVQNSVRLDIWSEPEPDLVIIAEPVDRTVLPGPRDVLLVIEVAETSLAYDRATKAPLYAEAGVSEYWIVNLVERVIEVYREPGGGGYRQVTRVASGPMPILALPDLAITFEQIIPPEQAP